MSNKKYGSTYFSKATGISRTTLFNMKENGRLTPNTNKKGQSYYGAEDFLNKYIVELMDVKGKKIPDEIKSELFKSKTVDDEGNNSEPTKLKIVPVSPKIIPIKKTTTFDDIPTGQITKVIKPLKGMTNLEGEYWDNLIKELVEVGLFHKGDVYTLREYCSCLAQIDTMKIDLINQESSDDTGRINPLITAIDKYRNSATNYATKLYLTPQSRKDIKLPEKASVDEQAWDKLLKG